jgi:hypothetical protein
MKTTEQYEMHWADLMHQLEHSTTFSKRQFRSIGYVVASLKAKTEKKIEIIEEIIKWNVKQENNEN